MELTIREASVLDGERLAELCRQLGYEKSPGETTQGISDLLQTGRDKIFVAASPSKGVVGWIHLAHATSLTTGWFGVIVGLVVDESFRGQGIGKALVAHALRHAREFGVSSVRVRSQAKRQDAHRFYKSLGFEELKEQKVFDIKLK